MNKISEQLTRIEELLNLHNFEPLTIPQAATFLGISKSRLYQLTSKSCIPHYKPGGKILFDRSELSEWVRQKRVKPLDEVREVGNARD